MGGYTKNIAVIRGLKSGFSVDGGPLSGLVKAEKYGGSLKVEVSLINFAPLNQGKYVAAISDGKNVCVLDGAGYEGASEVDTGGGFAALICFVNDGVLPVASAVCGDFGFALTGIREAIEQQEFFKTTAQKDKGADNPLSRRSATAPLTKGSPYEDEAIAEENYYEYGKADKDGGAVRQNSQKEKKGNILPKNEAAVSDNAAVGGLFTGGNFFDKMKAEIEKVLAAYPREDALESTVENSRWVRIDYGDGKFYVFGVIYGGGKAQYICYGIPSDNAYSPPESFSNSSFIPASENGGYWVMYQDAATGASINISSR